MFSYRRSNKVKFNKCRLLLIIALAISIKVSGQTNDSGINLSKNNEIWFDVYLHYYINDKLEYYGDAGFRTIINDHWQLARVVPSDNFKYNDNAFQIKIKKTWIKKMKQKSIDK